MTGKSIPLDILKIGAQELGIELGTEQLDKFDTLARLLVERNNQINLTRITEPLDIVRLHYLDSLTCLAVYQPKPNTRVIDVGTGAGFPGLAVKIAQPELPVTLVDATAKKVQFVNDAITALGLAKTSALCARAEDIGRNRNHRHAYGVVYARALAALPVVAELCLPLLHNGGVLIAQKASDITEELKSAEKIITELGATITEIKTIIIPGTNIERRIVIISKTHTTAARYPRPYPEIIGSRKK